MSDFDPFTKALSPKASISLQTLELPDQGVPRDGRLRTVRPMAAGFGVGAKEPSVQVICTVKEGPGATLAERMRQSGDALRADHIVDNFYSLDVPLRAVPALIADPTVQRIHTLKRKARFVNQAGISTGAIDATRRLVAETGRGTVVAIVDSGFDLSHPMFRDSQGQLRVDALLDQTDRNREYSTAQLESGWAAGRRHGHDTNGHGTHVASIAAGSRFGGLEGIAPDATFVLVKSDFIDIAGAVRWAFGKAGVRPCVANLSLGHHFGSHDGTDAEERALTALTGPGRMIVAAAGNERQSRLHIGGRFNEAQTETAHFDCERDDHGVGQALMTLWHDAGDDFAISVTSPTGMRHDVPKGNVAKRSNSNGASLTLSRLAYDFNNLRQIQIEIIFESNFAPSSALSGWELGIVCRKAQIGRIDGWFANEGFGRFRASSLVETARTVGMPSTAEGVICVASHVSKNTWNSGFGPQVDSMSVVGRTSDFSSRGPGRGGQAKPDVSAPGQYLTCALADGSELARRSDRAETAARLATIEGTSMASPVIAGVASLLLESRPKMTPTEFRDILKNNSVRDAHTGQLDWTPEYGYGKISAPAAVAALSGLERSTAVASAPAPARRRRARRQPPKDIT